MTQTNKLQWTELKEGQIIESAISDGIAIEGERYSIGFKDYSFFLKTYKEEFVTNIIDKLYLSEDFKLISEPPPQMSIGQVWEWQKDEVAAFICEDSGEDTIQALRLGDIFKINDEYQLNALIKFHTKNPEWLIYQPERVEESSVPDNVELPPEIHNDRPHASFDDIMKITSDLCSGHGTVTNVFKGLYS